jgi:WD40 repeat protein
MMAAACWSGRVRGVEYWDVAAHRISPEPPWPVPEGFPTSLAFSPDGRTLAAGFGVHDSAHPGLTVGGVVVQWDVAARRRRAGDPLPMPEGQVVSLAFSPDGRTLAAGTSQSTNNSSVGGLVLWDLESRQRRAVEALPMFRDFRGMSFSPDGRTLAVGYQLSEGMQCKLILWEVTANSLSRPWSVVVPEGLDSLAFSPDGRLLATGYGLRVVTGGGVHLWDLATRRRLTDEPLPIPEGWPELLAFSPDGEALAAKFTEGVVLWEVSSRRRMVERPLAVPGGGVQTISFAPDGRTILAGVGGRFIGAMQFPFVPSADREALACRIANRNLSWAEWRQYMGPGTPYRRTCPDLPDGPGVAEARKAGLTP